MLHLLSEIIELMDNLQCEIWTKLSCMYISFEIIEKTAVLYWQQNYLRVNIFYSITDIEDRSFVLHRMP